MEFFLVYIFFTNFHLIKKKCKIRFYAMKFNHARVVSSVVTSDQFLQNHL